MSAQRFLAAGVATAIAVLVAVASASAGPPNRFRNLQDALQQIGSTGLGAQPEMPLGHGLTECPQAGIKPISQPQPLDKRQKDKVEQISQNGDEQRANFEYSCFPHNETSIAVNPTNPRNAVAGANDYRLGWGTSGFYSTTDNGNNWYTQIIPFPSLPSDAVEGADTLDGGGDPALAFDRAGVAYYVDINFNRTDDTNGIFLSRSTNGGFTWSRPCIPFKSSATATEPDRCGGPGDPRKPGDGVVTFIEDCPLPADGSNPFCHPLGNNRPDFSIPFNDKEYVAVGRRPAGEPARCFTPTHQAATCVAETVGVDRIHVTWSKFECTVLVCTHVEIYHSYSDDQGRSWSPERPISGNAPFCTGGTPPPADRCDFNQFSTPTVSRVTGTVYVSFENFNTQHENQYLLVRSRDGGNTWEGPFFVTPVYDVNYPRAGNERPDCTARGQQSGRNVLDNSCFRVNSGGNVVVDRRSGAFADDLYLVMSDNRHGRRVGGTNTDVFLFKSTDGGTTWVGPTRVNNDATKNDNWFPWVDISPRGDVNVNFYDRRLDTESPVGVGEWPTSKTRQGNYLVWRFGAVCTVTTANSRECVAPTAGVIPTPPPGGEDFPDAPLVETQTVFPLKNFNLSDVPSNWDYSFRGGIFAGDYDVVAIGPDSSAWAVWTDARNGRSSRQQAGRNPACEQADVFFDLYGANSGGTVSELHNNQEALFYVTPCPTDIQDKGNQTTTP